MNDLEKKIEQLESRVKNLEKAEKRRKRVKTLGILIKVFIFSFIVVGLWYGYNYVKTKYINPYKEKVDTIEEKYEALKKINLSNFLK